MDINKKCREFVKEIWGAEFDLRIEISGKLTRSLGLFYHYKNNRLPSYLKFAKRLFNGEYCEATVDSVIKHELCHWYLYTNNLP